MENKNQYRIALLRNNGQLNEIDLGEKMGLNELETRAIIAQLLAEHSIEYITHGVCNYRLVKMSKWKNKK